MLKLSTTSEDSMLAMFKNDESKSSEHVFASSSMNKWEKVQNKF